jgi:hypothetical protein
MNEGWAVMANLVAFHFECIFHSLVRSGKQDEGKGVTLSGKKRGSHGDLEKD